MVDDPTETAVGAEQEHPCGVVHRLVTILGQLREPGAETRGRALDLGK